MKILIVSPFFPPLATVAIVRVSSLAYEFLSRGHEITVIRNSYDESVEKLPNSDNKLLNLETYTVEVDGIRYFEASKRYKQIFRKVMNKEKYDLVFITAGPYYTIPLCKIAKEEYNTKCVIDYRDLWVFDIRRKLDFIRPLNLAKKTVYFQIERQNIKYADLVVTVTENWKRILEKVYRSNNIEVISNGYDDKQLNRIDQEKDYPYKDYFVITAFGKLSYYSVEYGVKFFRAMKILSEKYPNLLVLHVGLPEKETEEAIKLSGFDKNKYINTGFINYSDGIRLLMNSDVNVIIDIRKGAMGTKFYDYVYVNRPLVYLGKKNTQLDNLVRSFENGFSCYQENDVVDAISKIKENGIELLTKVENVQKYARSKQNKRYLELINRLLQ